MAAVKKLPSGNYQVRWLTPEGFSRKTTFRLKADADRHAAAMVSSKADGAYIDSAAGKVTFQAYAEGWRAIQVHRSGTAAQIETNLRRHVYPVIGARPIGAIRHSEVQALVKDLHVTLKATTVELVFRWVQTIFKAAVADRVIPSSPCSAIKLPNVDVVDVVPMAPETVEALADTIAPRYHALIILGAGTGLRISEALGLTNDRVDWIRRSVKVDRQLVRDGSAEPVFGPVKDRRNRARTVPLPIVVVNALAEHVKVFGLGPSGLLFTNTKGEPVRRSTFSENWRVAAAPLGIPTGDGFHQLRHFYASVLIRSGESVKVVQKRLGHTSATMTLDIYGHLWEQDEEHTRTAIDDVFKQRHA
jgi:integrase